MASLKGNSGVEGTERMSSFEEMRHDFPEKGNDGESIKRDTLGDERRGII